ncbi:hypothetical protein [Spirosoma telluris]
MKAIQRVWLTYVVLILAVIQAYATWSIIVNVRLAIERDCQAGLNC